MLLGKWCAQAVITTAPSAIVFVWEKGPMPADWLPPSVLLLWPKNSRPVSFAGRAAGDGTAPRGEVMARYTTTASTSTPTEFLASFLRAESQTGCGFFIRAITQFAPIRHTFQLEPLPITHATGTRGAETLRQGKPIVRRATNTRPIILLKLAQTVCARHATATERGSVVERTALLPLILA